VSFFPVFCQQINCEKQAKQSQGKQRAYFQDIHVTGNIELQSYH
jgi:hypothetical protein